MEKSIFVNTLNSMCGAHNRPTWAPETEYYTLGFPDREGLDEPRYYYPVEPRDEVDTVDYEGW
jgi:hypothetical protein